MACAGTLPKGSQPPCTLHTLVAEYAIVLRCRALHSDDAAYVSKLCSHIRVVQGSAYSCVFRAPIGLCRTTEYTPCRHDVPNACLEHT